MDYHSATIYGSKFAATLIFVLIGAAGAGIPFVLKRRRLSGFIHLLNAFAGGAFLALGIFHILPESAEVLEAEGVSIWVNDQPYNATYILVFIGYLILLFCEQVLSTGVLDVHDTSMLDSTTVATVKRLSSSHQISSPQNKIHDFELDVNPATDHVILVSNGDNIHCQSSSSDLDKCDIESVSRKDNIKHPFNKGFDTGAFCLMMALAIHGVFEGMIVGSARDLTSVWITTAVIAAHKWAESFMLMLQMLERHLSQRAMIIFMGIFIASSPIGTFIGIALSSDGNLASGICNALGAGTVLYVAAEISTSVFCGDVSKRLTQFSSYCAGALLVFGLTLVDIAWETA